MSASVKSNENVNHEDISLHQVIIIIVASEIKKGFSLLSSLSQNSLTVSEKCL